MKEKTCLGSSTPSHKFDDLHSHTIHLSVHNTQYIHQLHLAETVFFYILVLLLSVPKSYGKLKKTIKNGMNIKH